MRMIRRRFELVPFHGSLAHIPRGKSIAEQHDGTNERASELPPPTPSRSPPDSSERHQQKGYGQNHQHHHGDLLIVELTVEEVGGPKPSKERAQDGEESREP